ncbi:MAG: VTT domain-containing protein [Patescibacteria group bacterium]
MESFLFLLDPTFLVKTAGLAGVIAIVFAESGLFFGFFFPGDSLLFTAGLLSSQGLLPIGWLLIGTAIAAILGDSVGYWFGKKTGPAIFSREDSLFFHKKHVERAQRFYELHGKKTIILARFIPIVRTFAPILAGVGKMDYRTFLSYNIIGGLAWSLGLTSLGYFLGGLIPSIDRYLLPIVLGIIAISFIPIIREYLRSRRNSQ